MILNSPSIFVQCRLPMTMSRRVCFASATSVVNTQQLREQLDRLHKEAETTSAKANSARLRLIRLSEAADGLRRQAVLRVQNGKENDARDLLYQKKKIMQAMEKSKNRIELLDELSAKLHQLISAKETQLIGNVALDLDVNSDDTTTNIRIVPPKDEYPNASVESDESLDVDEKLQADPQSRGDQHNHGGINTFQELLKGNSSNGVDASYTLNENNSHPDFFKNIDCQLNEIESELTTFLRYSALIFGNKDKIDNSRVQIVAEILETVCHIRGRIATITQTEVESR